MSDIQSLLRKQARWQQARVDLSWGDKLRQSEKVREGLTSWVCSSSTSAPMAVRERRDGRRDRGD